MQAFFESTAGIVITALAAFALVLIGIGTASVWEKKKTQTQTSGSRMASSTRRLMTSAMLIAVGTVLSFIKVFHMPQGGSVTLLSMFAVTLIGYLYGPVQGILSGMAYGLIQLILGPYVIHPAQLLVDYPLAFGALGLSGLLRSRRFGLFTGFLLGVFGRLFFSVLSGVIFFSEYAGLQNPIVYSTVYNGAFLGGEALLTVVILLIVPQFRRLLERMRLQN